MPDCDKIIGMKKLFKILEITALLYYALLPLGISQSYSAYSSIDELMVAENSKYADFRMISKTPGYTGFWFFGIEQFDKTDRYVLAMKVYFKDRDVTKNDVADIGYFDLKKKNRWTKIGTTTAWKDRKSVV